MTVNGPELKLTLGALGLSAGWFAEHMGVTMRTVVRWCDNGDVSMHVADELKNLCDQTLQTMGDLVVTAATMDPVWLITYRTDEEFPEWTMPAVHGDQETRLPAAWHRQMTFRLMEHFRAEGRTVKVRYE